MPEMQKACCAQRKKSSSLVVFSKLVNHCGTEYIAIFWCGDVNRKDITKIHDDVSQQGTENHVLRFMLDMGINLSWAYNRTPFWIEKQSNHMIIYFGSNKEDCTLIRGTCLTGSTMLKKNSGTFTSNSILGLLMVDCHPDCLFESLSRQIRKTRVGPSATTS